MQPFAYVMSCSGGAHKAISGSFSFFSQNVEKIFGALNFHSTVTKDRNEYVAISGNFTPAQRQIVKNHCQIDVQNFHLVYQWQKENNPNFTNMADSDLCPTPIILEDDSSCDEDPVNPRIENEVDIQYWFPNNGGPNNSNSIF
jgi:hypothetical protein